MEIIKKSGTGEMACLGTQTVDYSKEYRVITYNMQVRSDDGLLFYNNLTGELILIDEVEEQVVRNRDMSSTIFIELIEKWYFVPMDCDDIKLCNQVNHLMHLICDADSNSVRKSITEYTILTTTDCNARCFYCYEMGRERIKMSDKTANDVADFIARSCGGKSITFRWFGGEPLYNLNAIDIICKKLQDNDIEYKSTMISNGYLFDDQIIKKAVELWKLDLVQITLDGTEKIYNKCKAYIYSNVNPYNRVILNIKKLLDVGITVKIRMNADKHNLSDLFDLTDILYDNFGEYKNLIVYSNLLFENEKNQRNYEQRKDLFNKHSELIEYIENKNMAVKYTLENYLRYRQCMADNPGATVILPDGHLGRCEHFSDTDFWGSIYNEQIDVNVIEKFKRVRELPKKCDTCVLKPACIQLENCPDLPRECDELYKESYIINTKKRIMNTYIDYKTQQN